MGSRYFAISLLLFILNASFSIPAAISAPSSTFTVQIQSLMNDTLVVGCDLNGSSLPKQEIELTKQANFTVNLKDDKDVETLTCDLRSGDKHGSFVMFDSVNWNVSSYCALDSVCQWKVVSEGICLFVVSAFDCLVSYNWP